MAKCDAARAPNREPAAVAEAHRCRCGTSNRCGEQPDIKLAANLQVKQPRWSFGLLGFAGVLVIAWLAWHSHNDLLRVLRGVSPYWLMASIGAGIALNLAYGLLFDCILSKYGGQPRSMLHVAVYMMSQPAKYVPGKVWQAVMQSIVLRGRSSFASVGVTNIELSVVAVLHATGLGLICLFASNPPIAIAIAIATVACGWALIRFPSGRMLLALIPWLRHLLRPSTHGEQDPVAGTTTLLYLTAAALSTNFAASWWLLVAAHTGLSTLQVLHLLASLWLGIATSLLALPIPAGLGIREAAMTWIGTVLVPGVPTNLLISIALLVRCWQLLVDFSSMCAGWVLWHVIRRAPTH